MPSVHIWRNTGSPEPHPLQTYTVVGINHNSCTCRLCIDQIQCQARPVRTKETLARAQDNRKEPQAIFIDEVVVDQSLG
jgi:hypothetical protein